MLNMDSFFQKFTLPIIKTEDLTETIDISPKNTVKQWDLEVTEKFVKHTFFTSEKELDTIMKTYVSSLKNRAIHFKDKPLLKEKILNHVKILHLCFKGKEQNYIADACYYQYMEEILTIYCNLELGLARHLRRNEMPTKDYNHQINAISRRICKMLSIFLERKKYIIHVLLKLTFRSNIHANQYIMRLVFMHFLMKSPLENLSDEAFCRYYLAFERYKEVSTEDCRAKMDDALFLRFQKKPDFLKTSEIMKKVLRPANYSITGIINHLIDYKSVTVQAYFDYMKNKNCEELPDVINILNFHDNEEHSKDENNFGRVYNDVIKSFTNKPSHLEIKEEECIELDSDSDVAVTSDGLIQLILGDSDDEICEIAFMENSINNKHKSRKKRKLHDAYPIVSYIDLDNDIPTTSPPCQELTQMSTPTTTTASISTSIQSLSLSPQSIMTVSRSQQTSPLKESDSGVCESMLCENSNACSSKYPSNQVEEPRRITFKAVEIQTDPLIPRSCRTKENYWNTEMKKVFSSQISERTTCTGKKSVGVDPMHQRHEEDESSKENHHMLNKSFRNEGQFGSNKRITLNNSNTNKRNVDVMDSEVECIDLIMDERNEISNILVKSEITKKKLTFEASTNIGYFKQNKETIFPLLPNSQLSHMPKTSVSTQILSLNSQPVKTVSRSQQTSQGIENNNNNSLYEENYIDITNDSSPKVHDCKKERRVSFKVVETQTVESHGGLNQLETSTHSNSVNNAKEYCTDSMQQRNEDRCKISLMDDQINETRRRRSVTFNNCKLVDSEVQCVVGTAEEEEPVMVITEPGDNLLKEKITDFSPKDINSIMETATHTKVQNASEKENVDDASKATCIEMVIDDNVSSPEVEIVETDPDIQTVNKPIEKKNVACEVESKNNIQNLNNQQENYDVPQTMEVDVSCSKQNSTHVIVEENLDVNCNDNDTANSGGSNSLIHERDTPEPRPIVQVVPSEANNSVNQDEGNTVNEHENMDTSESAQNISVDNPSSPNKTSSDANSNELKTDLKVNSTADSLISVGESKLEHVSDLTGRNEKPSAFVKDKIHLDEPQPLESSFTSNAGSFSSVETNKLEHVSDLTGRNEKPSAFVKDKIHLEEPQPSESSFTSNAGSFNSEGESKHEHVNDLTGRNEKPPASVKDKIYLEEPQSSESSFTSHETSFEEEETVIHPLVFKETQLHSSADKISGDAAKDVDTEISVTNSIVNATEKESSKNISNKSTENEDNELLAKNVTSEGEDRFIEKRKLDDLKDNGKVEMNHDVHEEINEKSNQDVNTGDSGGFENVDKLNGLRLNSQGINDIKSSSTNVSHDTSQKRNKAKRSIKFNDTEGTVEANTSSVPVKIQRLDKIVEPSVVAVEEVVTPANSVEFLEQSFTAEEPTISDAIVRPATSEVTWPVAGSNVSNININTPNVVIYNFIIQNPVAEAITSQNITEVTEVIGTNEVNVENPCNTEENTVIEQNIDETDNAANNIAYTEQFTSETAEAETPTVENEVSETPDDHDITGEDTIEKEDVDKSKHGENTLKNEKSKTSKTVYTCESVKEIPLEEFSRMEKKFSHLLNSSERDEFEDVFSGPVTRLNKNSSNSLYYENSNGFKFDLFSFAKSQPIFCSNLDEKDFVLENKGNSPASSRSGSPTVSPEYEVFDWSDFGNYMEQSQKDKTATKYKQSDKPKSVKKCKFSETVKTRFIDSDSEYSDHLVPMDSLKGVQYEHRCEDVMWNGIKCFMDPNDAKLLSETSVALSRISDKELAYRIYRPNMEKFVYQESEPYKKPKHNTSRSCIQQKLDFKKDDSSHRTEAYARLGNFVSSNYPTEDYTPIGVGGFNSSNYVPTTRISDKGSFEYEEFSKPWDNKKGFRHGVNGNLSVPSTPRVSRRGRPRKNTRTNSEDQMMFNQPKKRRKVR